MTNINIGEENNREKHDEIGESRTQICQSFLSPIGIIIRYTRFLYLFLLILDQVYNKFL